MFAQRKKNEIPDHFDSNGEEDKVLNVSSISASINAKDQSKISSSDMQNERSARQLRREKYFAVYAMTGGCT